MIDEHYQIGEVAERVGLSLRTIRYYEEIGLVTPSGRTEGGFRLYTEADADRLYLIKVLKPVGMSLETMAELLDAVDQLTASNETVRPEARAKLEEVLTIARDRCDALEERLVLARSALIEIAGEPAREGL